MEGNWRFIIIVLLAAATAVGAPGCERSTRPPPQSETASAQVSLFNATHDILVLRTQLLKSDYAVDCDLVGPTPDSFLSDGHLSTRETLSDRDSQPPFSGIELPLTEGESDSAPNVDDACRFSFVSPADDRLPAVATSWPGDLEEKLLYTDVDAPKEVAPEPPTLVAEAIYDDVDSGDIRPWRHRPCGGSLTDCSEEEQEELVQPPEGAEYHWSVVGDVVEHAQWEPTPLSERPVDDPEDDNQCNTGRDATPLSWDSPPSGTWRVAEVDEYIEERGEEGGDDQEQNQDESESEPVEWVCQEVLLEATDDGEGEESWSFCGSQRLAATIESADARGDVHVEFYTERQDSSPPAVYDALTVELERMTEEGELFETETVEVVRGHGVPEHIGLSWETEPASECEARREIAECDQIIVASHLELNAADQMIDIRPGETVALDTEATRRVEFVRGLHRAVTDLRCQDERLGPDRFSHSGAYLEFLYYPGPSRIE